ncbi:hypothetical protein [Sphingobium phenoxybenzoativorans]|uniref:hypothetical protein n=1 Tax=Sphingobium phenoxybenzoativorans TaxID=1592790 RepID=UPI0008722846|nr:hypothetical protein [Sphingobium phenoxybenzoativorans]
MGIPLSESRIQVVADDSFWTRGVVCGGPETIERHVREFADIGVGLFQVASLGQFDAEARAIAAKSTRLFAERIIPEFRGHNPRE